MTSLEDVMAHLKRRQYTPKPSIDGVCGYPIPNGLFVNVVYQCTRCGAERVDVVPMVIGISQKIGEMGCLAQSCKGTFSLTPIRLECRGR